MGKGSEVTRVQQIHQEGLDRAEMRSREHLTTIAVFHCINLRGNLLKSITSAR